MSLYKRRSFTIVEIESMEVINIKKIKIDNALKIINLEQTKLKFLLILYYNFIKNFINYIHYLTFIKICINDIYYNKYHIHKSKFFYNDQVFYYKKQIKIYLYDNGIILDNSFIPYEYIISFRTIDNSTVKLKIFANLTNINSKLQFELTNGIVDILLLCDKGLKICNLLKKNMFYHIKYNKINEDVIYYYINYFENKQIKKIEDKKFQEIVQEEIEDEKSEEIIINDEN